MVWVLALRSRQPAVLTENGVELELAALRQSLALIHFRLRSSAQPDGWGRETKYPRQNPEFLKRAALQGRESQQAVTFAREQNKRSVTQGPAFNQAGAAEPALPGRRRSGPLGGQGATRSERPWGL